MELSKPCGMTGTITMKMISSTNSKSISGDTLISDDCEEEPAENAMEHLKEVSERLGS
jgi:hypothetical protein